MKKRLLALGLVMVMGVFTLTACTDVETNPDTTNPPIENGEPGDNPVTDPVDNPGVEPGIG